MKFTKGLQIWDAEKRILQNIHESGTLEFTFVQTVIACIEEAALEDDLTLEGLMGRSKAVPLSVYRGFLMVMISRALAVVTSSNRRNSQIAASVFGRNRCMVYHFTKMDSGGHDLKYEEIRSSPFGKRVQEHLNNWTTSISSGKKLPALIPIGILLSLLDDCESCKKKVMDHYRSS